MTGRGAPPHPGRPLRREPRETDVAGVRALVADTGMFSEEEIALAADLVRETLAVGPASGYRFLFLDADAPAVPDAAGSLLGYACHGPIPATRASHDLYWIAVTPSRQGKGLGRVLLAAVEQEVADAGGCRLYVDTSGRDAYRPTRAFYERAGYARAATLPDFYAPGDAKVIYCKRLG